MNEEAIKRKVSILIVEDDEHIALALQTVIKKEFDCHLIKHAYDGGQAWKYLEENRFDLIVSDWNMPGITGQDLLNKVRKSKTHCNTPFLMLTARADKNSVLTAIQTGANDYISKPYRKDQLLEKLHKLIALSTLRVNSIDDLAEETTSTLNNQSSKDIINYILMRFKDNKVQLPVLPHVYTAVSKAMDEEDVSFDKIINIIQAEPAISTSLITISNSSFYRGFSDCKTLEQAISRIGLEATRYYIFTLEGRLLFSTENDDFKTIMNKLWEHALATATCARIIGQQLNQKNVDILFSMGLLHDIGKLALINILIEISEKRRDIDKATIQSVFETLHTEIGAIILTQWNFPKEIINTVKYHHDLSDKNHITNELLIINLANILVRTIGMSLKDGTGIVLENIESAKLLNMDNTILEQIREKALDDIEDIKGGF